MFECKTCGGGSTYAPCSCKIPNWTQGRKDDAGKARYDLVPFDALDAVTDVMTYGAGRYGDRNWEDAALSGERLIAGALRHISAHMQGKKHDTGDAGSGKLHLAHATTALLMALAKELRSNASI